MKTVKHIFKLLLSVVYPNKCICCGEIMDEGIDVCEKCKIDLDESKFKDICFSCGMEKENCVCKYNIFRFNAVICTFKNIGSAKKAYYSYKFAKKQHYGYFFAKELSDIIKRYYSDIDFDFICAVPSFNRFNYDHSGYIAQKVSDILRIPLNKNILTCTKRGKKQHKSTIEERLYNVDGKYRANFRIDNKKILLIDDIKTTGATLDECAKMLLFAGADSVFCATVLGADTKNKKIEK